MEKKNTEIELHPECQRVIDYLIANKTDNSKLTIDEIRKNAAARSVVFSGGGSYPFDGVRTELCVPSPDVEDGIPVYVYTPNSLVSENPVIFVYAHGGGMTIGSRMSHDSACKVVSQSAGCIIANVEYRLAPEHKFPAGFDDVMTVLKWAQQNKRKLGGTEASNKVGLGGDSAGGTITASVAHDVPMDFQVLVYPRVTKPGDFSLQSFKTYVDGPLLTLSYIKWFESNYLTPGDEEHPRLASILRPKFDHLPPALMIIPEHDPTRDGCRLYVKKLEENNVPVESVEYKGAIHSFYSQTLFCPTLCKDAYEKVSNFIKKIHQS